MSTATQFIKPETPFGDNGKPFSVVCRAVTGSTPPSAGDSHHHQHHHRPSGVLGGEALAAGQYGSAGSPMLEQSRTRVEVNTLYRVVNAATTNVLNQHSIDDILGTRKERAMHPGAENGKSCTHSYYLTILAFFIVILCEL